MSTYAKKDKEENEKIIKMKEDFEQRIEDLKTSKTDADKQIQSTKEQLWEEQNKAKELARVNKDITKELDALKRETAKKDKLHETALEKSNAEKQPLIEQQGILSNTIDRLHNKIRDLEEDKNALKGQIGSGNEAVKMISEL